MALTYANFDVLVLPEADGYQVRLRSLAGDITTRIPSPLADNSLRELLDAFARSRNRLVRGLMAVPDEQEGPDRPAVDAAKLSRLVGEKLYSSLFKADASSLLETCLAKVDTEEQGLRILLRLNDVPELASLPWEYLCSTDDRGFLGRSHRTPIVRYLEVKRPVSVLQVPAPLRVLVVIASPSDQQPLQVAREWQILADETRDLSAKGMMELVRLAPATWSEFQHVLRSNTWHGVHFIGHGAYDTTKSEGRLLFETEAGLSHAVAGTDIAGLLAAQKVGLVVLNACEGATTSVSNVFAGLAQSLISGGIMACIAMQQAISDGAAVLFSREFYRAVADLLPIDGALAEARTALAVGGFDAEWATPVLYMRSPDGQIFIRTQSGVTDYPVTEPDRPPATDQFVGRDTELNYYAGRLQRDHLAVIVGMPGMGKSWLAAELVRQTADLGSVFWIKLIQTDTALKVIRTLAQFAAWNGDDDLWQSLEAARVQGRPLPDTRDLIRQLMPTLRDHGYILCFDDAQKVDAVTEFGTLLETLREAARTGDLSLVVTAWAVPAALEDNSWPTLGGLVLHDAKEMLASHGIVLADDLTTKLLKATEGNAKFLDLAINVLNRVSNADQFIKRLADSKDVSKHLKVAVDELLSIEEREVLCAVAVLLDQPGTRQAIEAVLDGKRVKALLDELSDRHLLSVMDEPAGDAYGLHGLLQPYFYNHSSITTSQLQAMHLRVATFYESEEVDSLRAARHFQHAGQNEHAAGLATSDVWSTINAGHGVILRQVLDALKSRDLTVPMQARVLLAMGLLLSQDGNTKEAQVAYKSALDILAPLPPSPEVGLLTASICREQGEVAKVNYDKPEEAILWFHRGLDALGDNDPEEAGRLQAQLGSALFGTGDMAAARTAIQTGLELLPPGANISRARALVNLGVILCGEGDVALGNQVTEEGLRLSEQLRDHYTVVNALANLAIEKRIAGDWTGGRADCERALDLATQYRYARLQTQLEHTLGVMCVEERRDDEALSHLAASRDLAREREWPEWEIASLSSLGDLYLRIGDLSAASDALTSADVLAANHDAITQRPEIYRLLAELHLLQGDDAMAEQMIEQALAEARRLDLESDLGSGLRVHGRILIRLGRVAEAMIQFEQSAAVLGSASPYEHAQTKLAWGNALLAEGRTEQGQILMEQADALMSRLRHTALQTHPPATSESPTTVPVKIET